MDHGPVYDDQGKLNKTNAFFSMLDELTVEKLNEPDWEWTCPVCHIRPDMPLFRGLQRLMTHANTTKSRRVNRHREFASLLDEEIRKRGISSGQAVGKWKDWEIVWPPMVAVMSTKLRPGNDGKGRAQLIGVSGPKLLKHFRSYAPVTARDSYDSQDDVCLGMLIFKSSAIGFLEAERLHGYFEEHGTDRKAWKSCRLKADGDRQLYGYMAEKHDVDFFNQHSFSVETSVKYEMRSYHEKVVSELKHMSEENQQQVVRLKDIIAKERNHSKALQEGLAQRLRTLEEDYITLRQASKVHHEQNKQEMDLQEDSFKKKAQKYP